MRVIAYTSGVKLKALPLIAPRLVKLLWRTQSRLRYSQGAAVSSQHRAYGSSAPLATNLVQECTAADWNTPLTSPSTSENQVVAALGKFDGMHQGHRLLAERAAASGANPYLLSFSGMAEVLGWPARLPLVASSDRARVLASWTPYCNGRTPHQRYLPFGMVRNLSPEAFVKVLAKQLQVSGVVVGQNYRFGYKAAGTSHTLLTLGAKYGLEVDIVNLVEAGSGGVAGQVSSSKIRDALNVGLMQQVAESLGRPYRLVAEVNTADLSAFAEPGSVRLPLRSLQNQPPMFNKTYPVSVVMAPVNKSDLEDKLTQLHCAGELTVTQQGLELSLELTESIIQHARDDNALMSLDFL